MKDVMSNNELNKLYKSRLLRNQFECGYGKGMTLESDKRREFGPKQSDAEENEKLREEFKEKIERQNFNVKDEFYRDQIPEFNPEIPHYSKNEFEKFSARLSLMDMKKTNFHYKNSGEPASRT